MKILVSTINSKFIHINNSVYIINSYLNNKAQIKTYTIKEDNDEILNDLITYDCDFYFFSVYIYNIEKYKTILPKLKNKLPNSKIIVGGPEVSYDYNYLFDYVDYIYRGEVNDSINQIINNSISSKHIVNKSSKNSNCNFNNFMHNYDYLYQIPYTTHHIAYIETSKGCPFNCSYCMSSLEKKVYFYSLEDVYTQIDYIIAQNVRTIKFLDRTFNIDENRMIEILKYIETHASSNQTFQFEIAPDLITEKLITYLQNIKAPIFRFEIGIQSIYDQTINAVDRYNSYKKYQNILFKLCNSTKAITHIDLIAGLPYETLEMFKNSFNSTFKPQPDEYQLGILKLLNGTKIKADSEIYNIVYQQTAPYTIINNKFLSNKELNLITRVEDIIDRYYNSKKFINTFKQVINNTEDYFTFCLEFNNFLEDNNITLIDYQNYDLFKWLYSFLDIHYPNIKDYVILDYLITAKTKPKRFYQTISKQEKNSIFKALVTKETSLNYLYKYCTIEILTLETKTIVIKDFIKNEITTKHIKK